MFFYLFHALVYNAYIRTYPYSLSSPGGPMPEMSSAAVDALAGILAMGMRWGCAGDALGMRCGWAVDALRMHMRCVHCAVHWQSVDYPWRHSCQVFREVMTVQLMTQAQRWCLCPWLHSTSSFSSRFVFRGGCTVQCGCNGQWRYGVCGCL